ncbi:MAG: hypothetical protein EWV58_22170 [Microcystis aeruginosa Ma_MB_F_20061100_S19]|nr:MAG: hypothetical protein EWV58_22170 [Microcystis aeruginosa Ma_MB_F_20061100_S19]TRU14748.1 MAG: hypothetical protein EWV59_04590 [Microcystis aeruginosa Ma_MB_F_20061100_S19D]
MLSLKWFNFSYQLSVISYQLSDVSFKLTVSSYESILFELYPPNCHLFTGLGEDKSTVVRGK